MKVFISWSGILSKNLAEAFKQWLPGVIQAVKPYYSPDDISKGSRWSTEISKELVSSKVGIICLTRENLEAPWIMFEAGALSKNIDMSKLCPILFNVETSDIQGPLVQFQAAKFSKEEIRKLMKMINDELGEDALAADVLDNVLEMWWPKLKESVEKILKDTVLDKKKSSRPERDILEEILELTRSASIQKERFGRGREVLIHPNALRDLVESYDRVATEIESFVGIVNILSVIDALKTFEKPLNYIVRDSDIPSIERERLLEIYDSAKNRLVKIYDYTTTENKIDVTPKIRKKKNSTAKR